MTTISRSALVSHSAEQMYNLVCDVDSYQSFLPWCRDSQVHSRDADEMKATIVIAKGGLERSFTTLNRLQRGKMMEMRLVEGPFRHLEGFWRFQALREDACKVSLDLDFEFSNRLMTMAFGKIFTQIANTLVDAFVKRANEVYGR
ncbi:ubiquinone-binding protein [Alkalilimnicola ehrlichii]|uniref:Ubiquinone-binding protein n=1 Tax=Alkalilimnicola ehrlichii TaxID=351052 RepID=A0A3E0WRY0_9GAMM|nr:type II toxin-antitoxin system RatA family toxin [Alkalilimnicola ehrlichii]RFA28317.1 ubiquinone-binding protein [Alkalilimnicola ehrlichii]RFA34901.1 ubiquinone-binding protein [Alkalilimnicola ehrlichii]